MTFARCLILVAIASMGSALTLSHIPADASTRKVKFSKTKRPSDYVIGQIRSAPSRKARRSLSSVVQLGGRESASHTVGIASSASKASIADALLEPPNDQTIEVLTEYGVPIIEGVPPIAFLFPLPKTDSETLEASSNSEDEETDAVATDTIVVPVGSGSQNATDPDTEIQYDTESLFD